MSVSVIDNDIKLDDANEFIKPFLKTSSLGLSTTLFKVYTMEIAETRIQTDKSLFFTKEIEETKTYSFLETRESVDLRKEHSLFPGTFSQINFVTSGKTQIYSRKYKKLFEIIIQIGGFFNGILYFTWFILYIYSKNIILWHCISSIISYKDIREKIDKSVFKIDEENEDKKNEDKKNEERKNENENEDENNNNKIKLSLFKINKKPKIIKQFKEKKENVVEEERDKNNYYNNTNNIMLRKSIDLRKIQKEKKVSSTIKK